MIKIQNFILWFKIQNKFFFFFDGKFLLLFVQSKMSYRLSDLSSKQEIHEDGIWSVSWRNQANLIVTGSVDSTIGVWFGNLFFYFLIHRIF